MDFTNKHVLVVGLAKSGLAAIRVLHHLNAQITLVEKKDLTQEPSYSYLQSVNVNIVKWEQSVFEQPYDCCIKNPGVPYRTDEMKALRKQGIKIITEIELGYLVAQPQHYCAITGSNGKTTTTTLLYEILKNAFGEKAHVCGNIGTPLCDLVMDEDLMNHSGHYIALELSNYQLICNNDFRTELATIINLSPDHIEFHGTLDEYYRSKTMIYKNMTKDDTFICNLDDALVKEYMDKFPCLASVQTFSLTDENADGYIKDGMMWINGEAILPLSCIKVVGRHNLQNILVAISMVKKLGVSNQAIVNTVSNFNGVEHRIEFVRELNGVRYYNDSKGTNTDATITALKAFDRGVILLVGGHEKGLPMDELKLHLGCTKAIIGYGKCGPRLIHELTDDRGILVETLDQALTEANKLAQSGDVVLLSPTTSSFDQYSCFEERGDHFKALVKELQ